MQMIRRPPSSRLLGEKKPPGSPLISLGHPIDWAELRPSSYCLEPSEDRAPRTMTAPDLDPTGWPTPNAMRCLWHGSPDTANLTIFGNDTSGRPP